MITQYDFGKVFLQFLKNKGETVLFKNFLITDCLSYTPLVQLK